MEMMLVLVKLPEEHVEEERCWTWAGTTGTMRARDRPMAQSTPQ